MALALGFHKIEIEPADSEKIEFSVYGGYYGLMRMPFGLKNAPSTFQSVMDLVLKRKIRSLYGRYSNLGNNNR